jgi:branched-chain amino acid transport system ATP-binding protein
LIARGIGVSFGGVHALSNVDVCVEQGEILGLIGPNGAGKTTLVNTMTGFQAPSAGRVVLRDQDITGWPPHRIARAGLARTFQSVRLFDGLSLYENVRVGVSAVGVARRRIVSHVTEALERVGLAGHADRLAGGLPYGDQRRLALARALATEPSLLLLDEPAAGLNERESEDLSQVLLDIRSEYDLGMVVVEHDLRLIMAVCDRIHVLDHGATIADGPPKDVTASARVREAYLGTGYA